jgi:hypothetical protein
VLTRFVISYHYSVVEVRRVGLNFIIHSGSVCRSCEHDISVLGLSIDAEFLIDNGIYINIKFINRCREFEIGRVNKLIPKR